MRVEQPETLEVLERAERRRRVAKLTLAVVFVAVAASYLLLPRTLASGEVGGQAWALRVAPVAIGSGIEPVGVEPAGDQRSVPRTGGLAATVVWWIGDADDDGETIVVGPTPRGVASVRVTTDEPPVGEARIQRVGWRRYHVDRIPGHIEVHELVAIDADGRPIEVSQLGVSSGDTGP